MREMFLQIEEGQTWVVRMKVVRHAGGGGKGVYSLVCWLPLEMLFEKQEHVVDLIVTGTAGSGCVVVIVVAENIIVVPVLVDAVLLLLLIIFAPFLAPRR